MSLQKITHSHPKRRDAEKLELKIGSLGAYNKIRLIAEIIE